MKKRENKVVIKELFDTKISVTPHSSEATLTLSGTNTKGSLVGVSVKMPLTFLRYMDSDIADCMKQHRIFWKKLEQEMAEDSIMKKNSDA